MRDFFAALGIALIIIAIAGCNYLDRISKRPACNCNCKCEEKVK